MTLSKIIRVQEGVSIPQRGSQATKTAWIGKKKAKLKSLPTLHIPLCQGIGQLLDW